MSLQPVFKSRDFARVLNFTGLKFSVNTMDWAAVGGCITASINVTGPEPMLWELIELLRCPVGIYDVHDLLPWHGFVNAVQVRVGGIEVGVTLDSMSNAVAVTYSYTRPGTTTVGTRKTTTWATHAVSVAEYGRKEFLSSQSSLSDEAAIARRDTILAMRQLPGGTANPFGASSMGTSSATITCKGWWDTLTWRYATIASVLGPAYAITSATEQAVGSTSSNTKIMQQFTVGNKHINVLQLSVFAKKVGSPADNLTLGIYALDASGNPTGSALASATIAGADLTTSLAWVTVTLSTSKILKYLTQYALQVNRSGATSGTNYYVVNVNEAKGYSGGIFRIWNGSAWAARSPDADMPFRIYVDNMIQSTQQIDDLNSLFGEFIVDVTIDVASGVTLPSYRDGDTTVQQEIIDLLAAGGPNGRRLLAEVTPSRWLHVWEEPENTPVNYFMDRKGKMYCGSVALPDYQPPVGQWLRLADVIPGSVDVTRLADPTLQFVEGAQWAATGGLRPRFRGQPSVEEIFKLVRR